MAITVTVSENVKNDDGITFAMKYLWHMIESAFVTYDLTDYETFRMASAGSFELAGEFVSGSAKIRGSGMEHPIYVGAQGHTRYITEGTVSEIDLDIQDENYFRLTGMSLDGADIFNGIEGELMSKYASFENLLKTESYQYYGNSGADILLRNTRAPEGSLVRLNHDDYFETGAGFDKIYAARGADTIKTGAGKDTLWGAEGNDKLFGGGGNDFLWGGKGRDKLWGGNGADALNGGAGNDRLRGGNGKDDFRFTGNFGDDVVLDFQDGLDKIDMEFGAVTIVQIGDDSLITHAGGTALLLNIMSSDLTQDDFI